MKRYRAGRRQPDAQLVKIDSPCKGVMKIFKSILLVFLFTVSLPVEFVFAQDFAPDLGDQLNKQIIIQNETIPPQQSYTNLALIRVQGVAPANPWLQWSTSSYSLQYAFGYNHSFLNGSVTKKDGGVISFIASAPYGFILLPSLTVSGSDIDSISGSETSDTLSIGPSIQIGHNLFPTTIAHFMNGAFTLYGNLGYTAADTGSLVGTQPAFSQMAGWAFGANAQYSVNLTKDLKLSLAPGYTYNNNQTVNIPASSTTSTFQGNVKVKLGANYTFSWISKNLVLSPAATWLRSINFSLAPGQSEGYQDWAEFGTDLMYSWVNTRGHTLSLDANYAYDAFNTTYYSYTVGLQLKYSF